MCLECGSYVAIICLGCFVLLGLLVYALVEFICRKRRILDRRIRMSYLELNLRRFTVDNPNELPYLVSYIQLLVELGFKKEEIHRKVLSCCLKNDFG